MRLRILSIGRMKSGPEQDLIARYQKRAKVMGRALGISDFDIVEIPESKARREQERQSEEMDALLQKTSDARLIIFDERFPSPSSEEFSEKLGQWKDSGVSQAVCIIGGPDGIAPELRNKAHWGVSFGKLSFPHQLVRVLVMEQLYRSVTLLAGHPYHRSGQG